MCVEGEAQGLHVKAICGNISITVGVCVCARMHLCEGFS